MKKPVIVLTAAFFLFSCDYILKKQEKTEKEPVQESVAVSDADKDENGCVPSAGYHWSVIKNDCIRPVEEGFRLNSVEKIEDDTDVKSAFVILSESGDKAELFLPDMPASIVLEKTVDNVFSGKGWTLHSDKGYSLKQGTRLLYVGAEAVQQGQVTGDENEES